MNQWVIRVIIVLVALALGPLLIHGVTELTVGAIDGISNTVNHVLVGPFHSRGSARLSGLIKLCLTLVFILLVWKVVFSQKG